MNPEQDPSIQTTKPGWQTSEFWAAAATVALPFLTELSDLKFAMIALVVIAIIYSRTSTKNTVSKGAADVAASRYKIQ